MLATLAGMPSLSRRKSTMRYRCLWPPPRCRDVMRPLVFGPPVDFVWAMRDVPAWVCVMSVKAEAVRNRRPRGVGVRFCTISDSEQVDRVVRGELDQGPLGVLAAAQHVAGPLHLALAVHGVHRQDAHTEDLLDGVLDLALVGLRCHLEGVGVVLLD